MHKHDQGIEPGCKWCDLDLLLRELSIEAGPDRVREYVAREMTIIIDKGGYRFDRPSSMGGGEDATPHEWETGHAWRGTTWSCWTCEGRK